MLFEMLFELLFEMSFDMLLDVCVSGVVGVCWALLDVAKCLRCVPVVCDGLCV